MLSGSLNEQGKSEATTGNAGRMSIDLGSVRCQLFSLHAHFPHGEPSRHALTSACGEMFLKKRGASEARYSVGGRSYRVRLWVTRRPKGETTIDVAYDPSPDEPPKSRADLHLEKLWKCLDETLKLPTWYCRARFEYPPSGYDLKYRLPSSLEKPIEGFSEIRGVRLARAFEGRTLYSVIVDRPDNENVFCNLFFTMQKTRAQSVAEDAFRNATEIVKLLVTEVESHD
jgi:hypothetical protein